MCPATQPLRRGAVEETPLTEQTSCIRVAEAPAGQLGELDRSPAHRRGVGDEGPGREWTSIRSGDPPFSRETTAPDVDVRETE